ncbi:MAG: three-Cys-motif partner protein TcmP [Hyphomicrobiaceae bacterium]
MREFGGAWSAKKLDCVSKYLKAYQTALKNKNFELVYIDAFCGNGSQKLKENDDQLSMIGAREFMRGSAQRAVELEVPFQRYHFIDKSKQSLAQLQTRLTKLRPDLANRMHFHPGDVNVELPRIVANLNVKRNRAVVFADPFGMQLDWETVEAVAACPIIDFWYLVPTGLALNRMATKSGKMSKAWSDRLDRSLGSNEWRTRWYRRVEEDGLFGTIESVEKVVDVGLIEDHFQARLRTAFPLVAKNRMQLKDQGRVLFTLMFACSNPSPAARVLASRIANRLLKG